MLSKINSAINDETFAWLWNMFGFFYHKEWVFTWYFTSFITVIEKSLPIFQLYTFLNQFSLRFSSFISTFLTMIHDTCFTWNKMAKVFLAKHTTIYRIGWRHGNCASWLVDMCICSLIFHFPFAYQSLPKHMETHSGNLQKLQRCVEN